MSTRLSFRALPIHALLAVGTIHGFARAIIRGVGRYAAEHGGWTFDFHEGMPTSSPGLSEATRGLICQGQPNLLAEADQRRLPVVVVASSARIKGRAQVISDSAAIGRMAAEHLLSRGLEHLAIWDWRRFQDHLPLRGKVFNETGLEAGVRVSHALHSEILERADGNGEPMAVRVAWLRSLPKPVGVFAVTDYDGRQLLDACQVAGLHVPDEVAVIAVDNNALLCELATPSLSSIDHGAERIGYEAAIMLERLINGEAVPAEPVIVSPMGVVARRSTEVLAVNQPEIAEAVRYIETHAMDGVQVDEVAAAIGRSRRWLQMHFKQDMRQPISAFITHCRMERVRQLLRQSDLTVEQIALKTGYRYTSHLSLAFKKEMGLTPTAYRRQRSLGSF